jgi:hypothetical protein
MIAGITYLSLPEQSRYMPALPEAPSIEQYAHGYSKGVTKDSFFEYQSTEVGKQNNILAVHHEENLMLRLILVVLGVWIGPCIGVGFAIVQVEGRQ